MALTFGGVEISGSVTLVDFGGQKVNVGYSLVSTDTAQGLLDMQVIAERLKAISACQVDRVTVNTAYTIVGDDATGVTNPAPAFGAEREHASVFEVNLADGRKAKLTAPSPAEVILNTADPDFIDVANTFVDSFLDLFKSTEDNLAVVSGQSIVGSPSSAYTRHKDSRIQVTRRKIG